MPQNPDLRIQIRLLRSDPDPVFEIRSDPNSNPVEKRSDPDLVLKFGSEIGSDFF